MVFRDITQLAIYHITEEMSSVSIMSLHDLYLNKTSEIIYIIKENRLYGIVCMGEALRCDQRHNVQINKQFTALVGFDIIKAHEIFRKQFRIHKIPIINEQGELLGDYSRWDDELYIEQNRGILIKEDNLKKILQMYDAVYAMEPAGNKIQYLYLTEYLERFGIKYTTLNKECFREKLSEKAICIFSDEDERRGVQCLYGLEPSCYNRWGDNVFRYDKLADSRWNVRMATFKTLLVQIKEVDRLERLGIKNSTNLSDDMIYDKASVFLSALQQIGIKCFTLSYGSEDKLGYTEYWSNFVNELNTRLAANPISFKTPWSKGEEDEEFYGDLFFNEDYKKGIAQKEIFDSLFQFEYKKNITGKYFNSKNGKRITCFQPEEYVGTIYLLGLCIFVGRHVEDQYTIASYLQKMLLEKGYLYRVENYATILRIDGEIEGKLEEIGKYHKNDIIIYQSNLGEVIDVKGIAMREIFEKYQISTKWVMDTYGHCNYKTNKLIASSLLEMIEPDLSNENIVEIDNEEMSVDFPAIMKQYVQYKYLNKYFGHFEGAAYKTIGAVVMKCNPFHLGHRYLIEQARKQVDFLIIFVIEEDRYLFPFEERFKMIEEGTADLDNIMVVPNGEFIFSKKNFREYYIGRKDESVAFNAEYDINVFADYIAKPLHITHRFAGTEFRKNANKIYNEKMSVILPEKGITYVEVPRVTVNGENINTSSIRKYLRNKEYSKAFAVLPKATKKYFMKQLNITEE